MNSRYLGALFISPLIIFIFLGGIYFYVLTVIISLLGLNEFYKVMRNKNINPVEIIGYATCLIYYFIIFNSKTLESVMPLNILILLCLLCIPVIMPKYNIIDVAVTYVGYLYVGVFFSFLPLINMKQFGPYLIWLPFIAAWSCDTLAYYSGRFFGKVKLCPKVSPNKTVEGAIGGLIGSGLMCGFYGYVIGSKILVISLGHYFIIGLICGVFCQFGDLVASSIKRYFGIKDYSNLIPGHGGILDRFDSILFASVVVYYYINFILVI